MKLRKILLILLIIILSGCGYRRISFNGIQVIDPVPTSWFSGTEEMNRFNRSHPKVKVETLKPSFLWKPLTGSATYDLAIWECILPGYERGRVAYFKKGIIDTKHKVETPLKPYSLYYWSVCPSGSEAWTTYNATYAAAWLENYYFLIETQGLDDAVSIEITSVEKKSKDFIAEKGKANIYLTQEEESLMAQGSVIRHIHVLFDGIFYGGVEPKTYHYFRVDPGKHTLTISSHENIDAIEFIAEETKNYFFDATFVSGWEACRVKLEVLGEKDGKNYVLNSQLITLQ